MDIGRPGGPKEWPEDDEIEGGVILRDGEGRPWGVLTCARVMNIDTDDQLSGIFLDNAQNLD